MTDELNLSKPLQADHTASERDAANHNEKNDAKRKKVLDDNLERGLEDSFPGSDPVAVTQPPPNVHDKRRP